MRQASLVRCAWLLLWSFTSCRGGQHDDRDPPDGAGSVGQLDGDEFARLCRAFAENVNATTCDRFDSAECPRAERDVCRNTFGKTFRCMVDRAPLRCDESGELVLEGCEAEFEALTRCLNGDVPAPTCPDPEGCP